MKVSSEGGNSFSYLKFQLKAGEQLITEAGAMASMDNGIDLRTRFNGGLFKAILIRLLGSESIFINTLTNTADTEKSVVISQPVPGEIFHQKLDEETLFLQPGAFIACSKNISFRLAWAGFSSWLGGEGLFRLRICGKGHVWYGAYGAVVEKAVDGEYIVDSGHLLSYPENIKLNIQMSGGIFSTFFSGEGLVLRLTGKGVVKLQTRSVVGVAGWLNPRFWR